MVASRPFKTQKKAANLGFARLQADLQRSIERVAVSKLRPARHNAHQHSKKQIRQIADSIKRFGFINPVIADDQGKIAAGHGRFEAAKLLGIRTVPVIRLSDLSETEVRAYMLADNKLAEKAGWDRQLLAAELKELEVLLPEVGLDLGITGFEPAEIDALMVDFTSEGPELAENIPPLDRQTVVSRASDLFVLGRHRLMVADARDERAYAWLMEGELAEMAFLDPPYNVKIAGHVGGRGRTKHREFGCASGEMSPAEFTVFLRQTLGPCAHQTADGGIHFVCMDWRHAPELFAAGAAVYDELKNICVWVKNNAGQGAFYRSQHELVFVFKHGRAPHLNTFELGQHGRMRSNVWHYAGVNSFRAGRMDELSIHPTVKPLALVVDAMRDCSRRGSIILDAFAGSGTTIMAAEQIGRRAFCLELDPAYVDVAIRRWQRFTGRDAVLESTGQTFDELTADRGNKAPRAGRPARSRRGAGKAA
jgi:DNA modification methylase